MKVLSTSGRFRSTLNSIILGRVRRSSSDTDIGTKTTAITRKARNQGTVMAGWSRRYQGAISQKMAPTGSPVSSATVHPLEMRSRWGCSSAWYIAASGKPSRRTNPSSWVGAITAARSPRPDAWRLRLRIGPESTLKA